MRLYWHWSKSSWEALHSSFLAFVIDALRKALSIILVVSAYFRNNFRFLHQRLRFFVSLWFFLVEYNFYFLLLSFILLKCFYKILIEVFLLETRFNILNVMFSIFFNQTKLDRNNLCIVYGEEKDSFFLPLSAIISRLFPRLLFQSKKGFSWMTQILWVN